MNRFKSIKMKVGQKSDSRVPKPPKPPEKPLMPYMRYSRKVWESVKNSNPHLKLWEVGKIIGQMWRELPDNEKSHFVEEYENDKIQYNDALRLYHGSPAYKSWLSHKERVEKSMEEAEALENYSKQKDRFQKDSHLVETRESYILEDNDEDPDEVFTVKHVAAQRYQRNQKLMLELYSDFKLPELGSVVTQNRLNTLVQQVDGLISHKRKLEDEIEQFQKAHVNKKLKIKTESEKFWNDYKKELDARPVITEKMFTEMVKKAREDIIREEKEKELYKTKQLTTSQESKPTVNNVTTVSNISTNDTTPVTSIAETEKPNIEISKTPEDTNATSLSNKEPKISSSPLTTNVPVNQKTNQLSQQVNSINKSSTPELDTAQKSNAVQRNLIEFNPTAPTDMTSVDQDLKNNSRDLQAQLQQIQSPCPSNISSSNNSRAPILSPAPEYLDAVSSNSADTSTSNPPISRASQNPTLPTSQDSNNNPPPIVSMQSPTKKPSSAGSVSSAGSKKARSHTNKSGGANKSNTGTNLPATTKSSTTSNSVELESVSSGGQRTPDSVGNIAQMPPHSDMNQAQQQQQQPAVSHQQQTHVTTHSNTAAVMTAAAYVQHQQHLHQQLQHHPSQQSGIYPPYYYPHPQFMQPRPSYGTPPGAYNHHLAPGAAGYYQTPYRTAPPVHHVDPTKQGPPGGGPYPPPYGAPYHASPYGPPPPQYLGGGAPPFMQTQTPQHPLPVSSASSTASSIAITQPQSTASHIDANIAQQYKDVSSVITSQSIPTSNAQINTEDIAKFSSSNASGTMQPAGIDSISTATASSNMTSVPQPQPSIATASMTTPHMTPGPLPPVSYHQYPGLPFTNPPQVTSTPHYPPAASHYMYYPNPTGAPSGASASDYPPYWGAAPGYHHPPGNGPPQQPQSQQVPTSGVGPHTPQPMSASPVSSASVPTADSVPASSESQLNINKQD